MQTLKRNAVRILGITFFILTVFLSNKLATKAAPTNPCNDICGSKPNQICTYIVGHGFCIGYPDW